MSLRSLRNKKERDLFTSFPQAADKEFKKVKRNLLIKERQKQNKHRKAQEVEVLESINDDLNMWIE